MANDALAMFEQLSFEQFKALSKQCRRVVVHRRFPADRLTPIAAYQALAEEKPLCLLESVVGDRYSFIGCQARVTFEARDDEITLQQGDQITPLAGDPIALLREVHEEHRALGVEGLPPLIGGAIGYFAYDAVRYLETLPDRHPRQGSCADISMTFFDAVIGFDHDRSLLTLAQVVEVGNDLEAAYQQATAQLDKLARRLQVEVSLKPVVKGSVDLEVESDLSDVEYGKLVKRAQVEIAAGEAFQIVLSRSFRCRYSVTPFDIYRALRLINPSPFMFFLDQGSYVVAGASPERLVSAQQGELETLPLAGTRPRGKGEEDIALAQELLADPKETAEHMMLVDLGRNDLGRVAEPGSVQVHDLKHVVRYAEVMHLATRVRGRLAEGYDALDALAATLPAGTLSGAPKIRAMELIDELEISRRGIYGGAVGYLSAAGDLDSCIAIRMAELAEGVATVRAGAGIVADSIPAHEAAETRQKALGVLKAIQLAEGGLP